jgi:D-alanyl-D-alanine carboxypeptidase
MRRRLLFVSVLLVLIIGFILTYIIIQTHLFPGQKGNSAKAVVTAKSATPALTPIPTPTLNPTSTPMPTPTQETTLAPTEPPVQMPTPTPASTIPTSAPPVGGESTCNDLLVLVDKTYGLSENYAPPDRVYLANYSIPVSASATAGRLVMISDLQRLFADSVGAGIDLKVISAYRSYSLQASIYASYVQQYGEAQANTFSAQPGHSQHQLGTAVDFSTNEIGYELSQNFGNTKAGQWLLANAYKYGFYLSYPLGQDSITGYMYEPWHFRYVGARNALNIQQSGIIMQTYLQQYGPRPNC